MLWSGLALDDYNWCDISYHLPMIFGGSNTAINFLLDIFATSPPFNVSIAFVVIDSFHRVYPKKRNDSSTNNAHGDTGHDI